MQIYPYTQTHIYIWTHHKDRYKSFADFSMVDCCMEKEFKYVFPLFWIQIHTNITDGQPQSSH